MKSGPLPLPTSARHSQQEILEDKSAFASGQRSAAGTARQLAINGLWPGFDFDDLIDSVAIRTIEQWSFAARHKSPHAGCKLYLRSIARKPRATTRHADVVQDDQAMIVPPRG
jgi:hypothetical protein